MPRCNTGYESTMKKSHKKSSLERSEFVTSSQPMRFHHVCGSNIIINCDGRLARRTAEESNGITFGNRAISVNERVYLKIVETSKAWKYALRIGFTNVDPILFSVPGSLPKQAFPDLLSSPGYWIKSVKNKKAKIGTTIFFFVNDRGEFRFGINNVEKKMLEKNIDVSLPLWPVVDVFGITIAVQFEEAPVVQNEATRIVPDVSAPSAPRFSYYGGTLKPLSFHEIHGRNVHLQQESALAVRKDMERCNAYVFTNRFININEKLIVQIMLTVNDSKGSLGFGLTTCDPRLVSPNQLPDDAYDLLDRAEYWVVSKNFVGLVEEGDEIIIYINGEGEVKIRRNDDEEETCMHVDISNSLWIFFDLYGNVQSLRLLGVASSQEGRHYDHSPVPSSASISPATPSCSNSNSVFPPVLSLVKTDERMSKVQGTVCHGDKTPPVTPRVPPPRPGPPKISPRNPMLDFRDLILTERPKSVCLPNPITPEKVSPIKPSTSLSNLEQGDLVTVEMSNTPSPNLPVTSWPSVQNTSSSLQLPPLLSERSQTLTPHLYNYPKLKPPPVPPRPKINPAKIGVQVLPIPAGKGLPVLGGKTEGDLLSQSNSNSNNSKPLSAELPLINDPSVCSFTQTHVPSLLLPASDNRISEQHSSTTAQSGGLSTPTSFSAANTTETVPVNISSDSVNADLLHEQSETKTQASSSDTSLVISECTVCLDNEANCVIYDCGHVCMCNTCAETLFKTGDGLCPICRRPIKDVIKMYKA